MSSRTEKKEVRTARVRFLTTEEGGRFGPPQSGVRSQLDLGPYQTSCIVTSASGSTELPLGEDLLVEIRPLFPDRLGDAFTSLGLVILSEGNKVVAKGRFTDDQPS